MYNYSEKELQEIHGLLLGLLKAFKDICEKENIWYVLGFGSVLGAVRHQGFIPWDSDADVCIKVTDVEKFRAAFYKNKPDGIMLRDRSADIHNTSSHESLCYERELPYLGIHLDIYPLIGAPANKRKHNIVWKRNLFLDRVFRSKYVDIKECLEENRKKVRIVQLLDKLIPDTFIRASIRNREHEFELDETDYWTCLCTIYQPVEKKVFDKITQMKFEDGVYNVPGDWDLYLKTLYGDYMTPKKY